MVCLVLMGGAYAGLMQFQQLQYFVAVAGTASAQTFREDPPTSIGFGGAALVVGDQVVIGAGAVVLNDIPSGETWVGNPSRKLR